MPCANCHGTGCRACGHAEVVSYDEFLEAQAERRSAEDATQLVELTLWRVTKGVRMTTANGAP